MSEKLYDSAYVLAAEHQRAAASAVLEELAAEFTDAEPDTIYEAADRAMQLRLAALEFARKVWARTYPYEKAVESLHSQFTEFPDSTVDRAFSDAYTETR